MISTRVIESVVTPAIDKSDLDGVWSEGGLQAVAGVHFVIQESRHMYKPRHYKVREQRRWIDRRGWLVEV